MSSNARNFAIIHCAVVILLFGMYVGYIIKKCEECPVPDYDKVDSLVRVSAQVQAQNAVLSADIQALKDSLAKWPAKRKPTKQRIDHEERAFRSAGIDSAALYLLSDPE
mgnify:CR=1 FL=1